MTFAIVHVRTRRKTSHGSMRATQPSNPQFPSEPPNDFYQSTQNNFARESEIRRARDRQVGAPRLGNNKSALYESLPTSKRMALAKLMALPLAVQRAISPSLPVAVHEHALLRHGSIGGIRLRAHLSSPRLSEYAALHGES